MVLFQIVYIQRTCAASILEIVIDPKHHFIGCHCQKYPQMKQKYSPSSKTVAASTEIRGVVSAQICWAANTVLGHCHLRSQSLTNHHQSQYYHHLPLGVSVQLLPGEVPRQAAH